MKNNFKLEVSFNLHTRKGEKIDARYLKDFQNFLKTRVLEYNDYHGSFYAQGPFHDRCVNAEQVKVKLVKS